MRAVRVAIVATARAAGLAAHELQLRARARALVLRLRYRAAAAAAADAEEPAAQRRATAVVVAARAAGGQRVGQRSAAVQRRARKRRQRRRLPRAIRRAVTSSVRVARLQRLQLLWRRRRRRLRLARAQRPVDAHRRRWPQRLWPLRARARGALPHGLRLLDGRPDRGLGFCLLCRDAQCVRLRDHVVPLRPHRARHGRHERLAGVDRVLRRAPPRGVRARVGCAWRAAAALRLRRRRRQQNRRRGRLGRRAVGGAVARTCAAGDRGERAAREVVRAHGA